MQIEVGEYKTRGGEDVTVIAVVDGIVIGYFTEYGPTSVNYWKAEDGGYFTKHDAECSGDLVLKKPKRIKFERWATIGHCDAMGYFVIGLHSTLERAKSGAECVAIVRVEIDCEEGENLD